MQRQYLAIIEKAKEGFGVFFPDLPGCTSWGATVTEAASNAAEAAQAHIALADEYGDELPAPTDIDKIQVDKDVVEAARILIPVEIGDEKVRVNITLPRSTLAALDASAAALSLDRSAMIAELVRSYPKSAGRNDIVEKVMETVRAQGPSFWEGRGYKWARDLKVKRDGATGTFLADLRNSDDGYVIVLRTDPAHPPSVKTIHRSKARPS